MRLVIISIALLLVGLLGSSTAYAYEGEIHDVYVQIRNDIKTVEDPDKFIKEIEDYVREQKAEDFTDRKLITMIVKFKNVYISDNNKIIEKEKRAEYIKEVMDNTVAKKEFKKIKNKIVLDSMLNNKYHELDLDIAVLEHSLEIDNKRLIEFSTNGMIEKYKNFKDFDEKEFVKEVKGLKSYIFIDFSKELKLSNELKSSKELKNSDKKNSNKNFIKLGKSFDKLVEKTKGTVDKIIKSRDAYNDPRDVNNPNNKVKDSKRSNHCKFIIDGICSDKKPKPLKPIKEDKDKDNPSDDLPNNNPTPPSNDPPSSTPAPSNDPAPDPPKAPKEPKAPKAPKAPKGESDDGGSKKKKGKK